MFLPMISPYISIIGFGEVERMSLADITADGIEDAKTRALSDGADCAVRGYSNGFFTTASHAPLSRSG